MARDHKSGLGRGLPSLLGNNNNNNNVDEKEKRGVDNLINQDPEDAPVRIRETYSSFNVNSPLNNAVPSAPDTGQTEILTETVSSPVITEREEKQIVDDYKNEHKNGFMEIDVALIEPNPEQPRSNFKEDKLQELANSINDKGVLEPILVRQVSGGKYQIIAGERRWQASRIARKTTIPAIILTLEDNEALEASLIENIQRDDLNPIEEAYAYKKLMDKMNYTQAELAKAVSKGRSTIANSIRLLDLPETAQEAMFKGKITAGHARAILSVPNEKGRQKLVERIVNEKLNVRDTEQLARILSMKPSAVKTKAKQQPSEYKAIAKSLRDVLKTNVRIRQTKTGNKLEITFANEEELRAIYEKLSESNED